MKPIIYKIEHKDTGEVHKGGSEELAKMVGVCGATIRGAAISKYIVAGCWRVSKVEKEPKKPEKSVDEISREADAENVSYGIRVAMTEYGMKIER